MILGIDTSAAQCAVALLGAPINAGQTPISVSGLLPPENPRPDFGAAVGGGYVRAKVNVYPLAADAVWPGDTGEAVCCCG